MGLCLVQNMSARLFSWFALAPIARHNEQFYYAICQSLMNCCYLTGEQCHTENECGERQVQAQITGFIMEITGTRWQESHRMDGLAKILPVFLRNAYQESSCVKLEALSFQVCL